MNIFETYTNEKYALSFEDMQICHNLIATEIQSDVDAKELYEDLIESATRYANYRANWHLWKREKQLAEDNSRTMCHDSLIIKFDVLARYLKSIGHSAEWREMLGDIEKDPTYRKRIGDFACYLIFVNSLSAR